VRDDDRFCAAPSPGRADYLAAVAAADRPKADVGFAWGGETMAVLFFVCPRISWRTADPSIYGRDERQVHSGFTSAATQPF